ncbi:zinc finger BED domain-containing protein 4-like [Chrysoperla carnea]|uniref:zinc finger BED domain-containing protein 4-like n=1 Tax=Chrysoperla carnea TaxID=189513 RepID=UPI001D07066F|nr:zinc finger BED domain-containing protein 4-like [Chrysoperla carnea]
MSSVKKKSTIWNLFTVISETKVKCDICGNELSTKNKATTNLLRHVKNKHNIVKVQKSVPAVSVCKKEENEEDLDESDNVNTFYAYDNYIPETSQIESTPEVSMKMKRSAAWKRFTLLSDSRARCNQCGKEISIKNKSTTNLIRHYKKKHLSIQIEKTFSMNEDNIATNEENSFDEDPLDIKPSISQDSPPPQKKLKPIKISLIRNKAIDMQLLKMIVKNYHPFDMIENVEFRKLISLLNPQYTIPDRKALNTLLTELHLKISNQIHEELRATSNSGVTITTDSWTSINNDHFQAITVHFLDENFTLKSYLLDCFRYNEEHSIDDISGEIKRISSEWNINEKISAVVTDNTKNISAAVEMCGWNHIPCFGHSLNAIVQSALLEIKTLHSKIKLIVEHFNSNTQAAENLESIQKQMGVPIQLKVVNDVKMYWISTYEMFTRILSIKESIISILTDTHLTEIDWFLLENVCEVLKFFEKITVEISAEKSVTISKLIFLCDLLLRKCYEFKNENILNETVESHEYLKFINKIIEQVETKLNYIGESMIIAEATLLDPRFKNFGFHDDNHFEKARQSVLNYMTSLEERIGSKDSLFHHVNVKTESDSLWNQFDIQTKQVIQNRNPRDDAVLELDKYLQEPLLPRSENPLIWWQQRKNIYPKLITLVKNRLCVIPTSLPHERIFSKNSGILHENRNRLSGSKISKILFLNANLDFLIN